MPNEYFSFDDYNFVWDEDKNQHNIRKHGVSFRTAAKIFREDLRIEVVDQKHSDEELRYDTIGLVDRVLFVVYSERIRKENESEIRIISARPATKQEAQLYNDLRQGRY